ncbi:AI-2E family transporter [Leucobacter aridicollis]|uniref:Putative PurR-regulated permease PerM n=1 Tax=Leucobacter aridicollis TaxID=283878 RepID=A0A852R3R0_9MICO|nr:AI-2E family transporter [Leucobacter aridicollis]NYD25608.1 putative PurR-regulated permease PerM [Leucobacter aridicollis]
MNDAANQHSPGASAPQPESRDRPASTAQPAAMAPSLTVLLGLAAAVVVLAGVSFAREVIGPLALAAVIVIICSPVRRPLDRRGWPSWVSTTVVVALSWAILLVLAAMLAFATAEFTQLVIAYSADLRATADNLFEFFTSLGLSDQFTDAITSVLTPSTIVQYATSLGSSILGVLTALFFIFAYAIFMAADAGRFARATREFGPAAAPRVRRFAQFNGNVRRYYVVNAAFGLLVAVVDGLALWALGIPAPLVWAILSFVTNFVPNIGFVLGLVPPAILALVVGGWPLMLAVVAVYAVANVLLQVLIQPKFVSDAVSLSLTLSFVSVLFWTFIIGPLGAILAIPLTLLVRALILERDPGMGWLRWLSGDNVTAEAAGPRAG